MTRYETTQLPSPEERKESSVESGGSKRYEVREGAYVLRYVVDERGRPHRVAEFKEGANRGSGRIPRVVFSRLMRRAWQETEEVRREIRQERTDRRHSADPSNPDSWERD